ncbi:chitinase c [Stigmatella aurantiaca DW4/3-1]|uniref:Chitinase c n=2 Tax=Stigmatella aurantiaca (strain DW4/3-1) TaxID=378806 RepID=Q08MX9_STIAD|nr:chitinase c [Stigmatella aurantiaca DW4/3-1]
MRGRASRPKDDRSSLRMLMTVVRCLRWMFPHAVQSALLLGWVGLACGGSSEEKDTLAPVNVRVTGGVAAGESVTGRRTLLATAEDDSGKVAKVEFYVSGALVCTDGTDRNSGEAFSCAWDSASTAQGSHSLTARAYDAAGNASSSEPIAFSVPAPNRAPTVTGVTASPPSLDEGSATTLSVAASDPDGEPLTYTWTQSPLVPAGTFSEAGGVRTWTAPLLSSDTVFTLRVSVSDGRGGTAQASVPMKVVNVPALNRPPFVDEAIGAPTAPVVAGEAVMLSIGASDLDKDPLSYSWKTVPAGLGTFSDPASSYVQWRSPDITRNTRYTFQVTVSDGTASETRTVDVQVRIPSYAQDIQPLWVPTCTTCHSDDAAGGLNLQEGRSYASLVNMLGRGSCSSLKRVDPGNPDDSLLVQKISGDNCGGRMPQLDTEYFDKNPGELTRIRSWILLGAPNN